MPNTSPDPSRGFVALPLEILDTPMSPGAFRALAEFCRMADRDGFCWPSLDQVGEKLGRSRAAVSGYVKELRGLALLSTEEQRTASGYNYRLKFRVTFWAAWRAKFGQAIRSEKLPAAPEKPAERSVQPVERPLKENQIHKNQSSAVPASGLARLHDAWKKVIGSAPYPTVTELPSEDLLARTRQAAGTNKPSISADIGQALARFLKTKGLAPDSDWLATIAPITARISRLPEGAALLVDALAQKWRPHWKFLPSPTMLKSLVDEIVTQNPEPALRNLLSGYLRRWDIHRNSLRLPA